MEKLTPVKDEDYLYRTSNGSIVNKDDETRQILKTKREREKVIYNYVEELNTLKDEMSGLKIMLQNLINTIQKQ